MEKPDLMDAVPEDVRVIIIDALSALSREHNRAYEIASRVASKKGEETPQRQDFQLFEIADVARRFGGCVH